MSDLEGNIYEPWIRWKGESESKSDSDNMQGPVIPEDAEVTMRSVFMKKLIIIGKTGTGKSSLCNKIAGYPAIADIFPVSSNATSCSQSTQFGNIKFNGNSERIMSLIDTIGFDDPDEKTDVERDAFTEGIDTFNVPNVMKEVDFQQLVENTRMKMNHDDESSSPSAFQSITKETFYQYMISLLLCYQVMFDCWITKNIMIVPQALKDLENNVVITQFSLLFLFSKVILESWIQLNTENPDRMQCGKHGGNHNTSNQSGSVTIVPPQLVSQDMKQGGKHAGHDEDLYSQELDVAPLHMALQLGDVKAVKLLLEGKERSGKVAKINQGSKVDRTALHMAAEQKDINIDQKDNKGGQTPLHLSVKSKHLPILELLIENGASVDNIMLDKQIPVHLLEKIPGFDLASNKVVLPPLVRQTSASVMKTLVELVDKAGRGGNKAEQKVLQQFKDLVLDHEIFPMGDFKFCGWNQESQRVCSRVTEFNEAIRLSEPLPNEERRLEIQVSPIYLRTFS